MSEITHLVASELVTYFDKKLIIGCDFIPLTSADLCQGNLNRIFPNNAKLSEIKDNVQQVNARLDEYYGARWALLGLPRPLHIFGVDDKTVKVTKFCKEYLKKQKVELHHLLNDRNKAPDAKVGWFWGPLPRECATVRFHASDACWNALRNEVPFDDEYFPDNDRFLNHYMKMHLRHRLRANQDLYDEHLAWFGLEPQGDERPQPFVMLWNTGLLSKYDRKTQLLIMCIPHFNMKRDISSPWFAVRIVKSPDLARASIMRDHLRHNVPAAFHPSLSDTTVILVDEDSKVRIPEQMRIPKEYMIFDPSAYPERTQFGNLSKHLLDKWKERIPQEFHTMSLDDLRSRAEWALERAADNPNIVLTQWFQDKCSDRGEPQLILPLTLDPPPALKPRLALILQIGHSESGDIMYNAVSALPLDVAFRNVLVWQPRGGHWLGTWNEDVYGSPFFQAQAAMDLDSDVD